jgi:hypothetical protein
VLSPLSCPFNSFWRPRLSIVTLKVENWCFLRIYQRKSFTAPSVATSSYSHERQHRNSHGSNMNLVHYFFFSETILIFLFMNDIFSYPFVYKPFIFQFYFPSGLFKVCQYWRSIFFSNLTNIHFLDLTSNVLMLTITTEQSFRFPKLPIIRLRTYDWKASSPYRNHEILHVIQTAYILLHLT